MCVLWMWVCRVGMVVVVGVGVVVVVMEWMMELCH